jgi:hypothetical protein
MTTETPAPAVEVAIAFCATDNMQWAATPATPACPICKQPPSHALPLAPVGSGFAAAPPHALPVDQADAEPVPYPSTCPHCSGPIELLIGQNAIDVVTREEPGPAAESVSEREVPSNEGPTTAAESGANPAAGGSADPPSAEPPAAADDAPAGEERTDAPSPADE